MKLDLRAGAPWLSGELVRRYKRFLADVRLDDGRVLTAHCNNPGRMTACSEPGRPVLISDSQNPRRKLRYTLEMIRMGRTWVGVNTLRPNALVAACVGAGAIAELRGYGPPRREVRYGPEQRSRVDLWLEADDRPACCVEIKNTTMRVGRFAAFPDAVTERGRKHLADLAWERSRGRRAVLFLFVGRGDCRAFRPADEVDPAYGAALREAVAAGVEVLAYRFRFSPGQVELRDRLPLELGPF